MVTSPGYPWDVAKRSLVIFLISAALLIAIAVAHFFLAERAERIERETTELLNVQLGKAALERGLESVTSDLMFLAQHNEPHGFFDDDDSSLRHVLEHQFLILSTQKGVYDQIRFIDRTGMEVVRVNYGDGNPTVVPANQLQNKAHRYYFEETWALARGDMYISPFDLNIEHGRIEQPPKPMIRLGTPVFDRAGRKSGVLFFNYLGAKLIGDFRSAVANISDHVMLLNADGYWLSSPRPDEEWGFMYGKELTFAKVHLDAWRRVKAGDTGQFNNDDGMFSFTTVHPLKHADGQSQPVGQRVSITKGKDYHWKVVSYLPSQLLTTGPREFLRWPGLLYWAMLGMLAVASILIARASVKQGLAATQVELEKRVRGSLEIKVEERTQALKDTQAEKDRVVEHLIQAEKMAAIGTMASGIGHEINNPLYAILGLAEAIRDERDISRCRGHGQDIITYCTHIAGIVRNLSGYARPAEKHDLEPVDVNERLSEAASMAVRSLFTDGIEIREDLMPVGGVSAKEEEIQQVFFNVIRNGIQAMEGKGALEISSRRDGDRVSISIRDSGAGIPAEHLARIYDPFFTTRGPDEGEGLGLYVVQQIVKKYGGTIAFESDTSKGTVCTIEFPARD